MSKDKVEQKKTVGVEQNFTVGELTVIADLLQNTPTQNLKVASMFIAIRDKVLEFIKVAEEAQKAEAKKEETPEK